MVGLWQEGWSYLHLPIPISILKWKETYARILLLLGHCTCGCRFLLSDSSALGEIGVTAKNPPFIVEYNLTQKVNKVKCDLLSSYLQWL